MSHLNALRRQSVAQRARKSVVDDPRNLQRILQAELQDYSQPIYSLSDPEFLKKVKIRKLRLVAKVVDTTSFVLATLGIVFATWDYELYFDDATSPHFSRETPGDVLQAFVSLTTALLMITMIIHSIVSFKLEKLRNPLYKNVSYLRSRFSKQLVLEIILNGIHCPPSYDRTFDLDQLNHKFPIHLLQGFSF